MSRADNEGKVRLLRSLAHHIHRKTPAGEALAACIEAEGRGGRHRQWRQAGDALATAGFVPALVAGQLVGEEAAAVLEIVAAAGDHRNLAAAVAALADYLERQPA